MAKVPGPQRGSPARYIGGMVCLMGAMVALPGGFIQMVRSLERGGYGTSVMTYAFAPAGRDS